MNPRRPLFWPDDVLDLHDLLLDEGPVYIVGGAVRDAYLHRPVHDLDLAVPAQAIKLARRIANQLDADFYVLDQERDVGRVLVDKGRLVIDVARFRGDALVADLADRDFTCNAMAVDLTGEVGQLIDPLNGEDDLAKRIVRRCSPHAIADDPIRALRAVRQSVQLNARIEPATLADIRSISLDAVSPERLRDELVKLLSLQRPGAALRVARALNVLPVPLMDERLVLVEKLNGILSTISRRRTDETAATFGYGMIVMGLDVFRQRLLVHIERTWPGDRSHASLMLFAAMFQSAEMAEQYAVDLRWSGSEKKHIVAVLRRAAEVLSLATDDLSLHRFWRQAGDAGIDAGLMALADYLAGAGVELDQDAWVQQIEQVQIVLDAWFNRHETVVEPPPLLDGHDLMERLDLEPGPQIGELLTLIREGQVTGSITTVDEALAAASSQL